MSEPEYESTAGYEQPIDDYQPEPAQWSDQDYEAAISAARQESYKQAMAAARDEYEQRLQPLEQWHQAQQARQDEQQAAEEFHNLLDEQQVADDQREAIYEQTAQLAFEIVSERVAQQLGADLQSVRAQLLVEPEASRTRIYERFLSDEDSAQIVRLAAQQVQWPQQKAEYFKEGGTVSALFHASDQGQPGDGYDYRQGGSVRGRFWGQNADLGSQGGD